MRLGVGVVVANRETLAASFRRTFADAEAHRKARVIEYRRRQVDGRALFWVDGQPSLRRSFVMYLDELGTSARLAQLTNEELRDDLDTYEQLRSLLLDETSGVDVETARALYFSDNVAVVTPFEPWDEASPEFGLQRQLLAIVVYQLNMMLRNRAIRGGLTLGMAYADHSFVTGPAHLAAVKLEENVAGNPRVLLDAGCREIVENVSADAQKLLQHYLLRDPDGEVFVNYLRGIEEDGIPEEIEQGLTQHRDVLTRALAAHKDRPGVHAKYVWAASYHNYVRRTFYKRHAASLEVPDIGPGQFRPV